MTNQDDLSVLLPSNWQPATAAATRTAARPARSEAENIVSNIHTCVCYLCSGRPEPPDAHPLSAYVDIRTLTSFPRSDMGNSRGQSKLSNEQAVTIAPPRKVGAHA